jgi:hypothetical protein
MAQDVRFVWRGRQEPGSRSHWGYLRAPGWRILLTVQGGSGTRARIAGTVKWPCPRSTMDSRPWSWRSKSSVGT